MEKVTYKNISYQFSTKYGMSCKNCDFSGLDYCPCDECMGGVFKKISTLRKEKLKKICKK